MRRRFRITGRIVLLSLLIIFLASSCIKPVSVRGDLATDLTASRARLAKFRQQLEDIQRKIKQNANQKYALLGIITDLNAQIDDATDAMSQLNAQIASVRAALVETQKGITEKLAAYKLIAAKQSESLRILYHFSNLSLDGLAFSGADFSDTVETTSSINAIVLQLEKNLDAVEQARTALETQQKQYLEHKKSLDAMYAERKEEASILSEQSSAKREVVQSLIDRADSYSNDEEKIQNLIDGEDKRINDIIRKLGSNGSDTPIGKIIWPLKSTHITDPFGWRIHPITGKRAMHYGVDLSCAMGTPVYAVADGVVIHHEKMETYGNMMILQHGSNVTTLYAHLKSWVAKDGQKVKQGQIIAYSDSTGWSTGPHLHFEIRVNGVAQNPMDWLP